MACCLMAALMIGGLRAFWFRLPGVPAPVEVGFAPVARRPGPSSSRVEQATPDVPAPTPSQSLAAVMLVFVALGIATYAVGVLVLLSAGWAHPNGSAPAWWLRSAALAVLALGCAVLAARCAPASQSPSGRLGWSAMLAGIGGAWWTFGIVDMHVFGLLEVGGGSLAADVVFHGSGLALFLCGSAMGVAAMGRADRTSPVAHHLKLVSHAR